MAQLVKNLPAMRETWVLSLGWEDPLEKGKATYCSILAWRIPWTVESDTTHIDTHTHTHTVFPWRRAWLPMPVFLPRIPWTEEPGGLRRVLEGTGGGRVRDDVCSSPE